MQRRTIYVPRCARYAVCTVPKPSAVICVRCPKFDGRPRAVCTQVRSSERSIVEARQATGDVQYERGWDLDHNGCSFVAIMSRTGRAPARRGTRISPRAQARHLDAARARHAVLRGNTPRAPAAVRSWAYDQTTGLNLNFFIGKSMGIQYTAPVPPRHVPCGCSARRRGASGRPGDCFSRMESRARFSDAPAVSRPRVFVAAHHGARGPPRLVIKRGATKAFYKCTPPWNASATPFRRQGVINQRSNPRHQAT